MSAVARSTESFQVLGPVGASRSGQPVELGGRRQRCLLSLLLVEPGRTVSSDRLIDELWHGEAPSGAEGTLRVYVSRLRSTLGDSSLLARPPGYALDIEPEQVDAWRFEGLYAEGRDALARGAAGMAADRLTAALALWRGPAFADVRDGGVLAREAGRLDELRIAALEERIDADLLLGRHSAVVPELERLVAEEPLRERLWRQLVSALHHSQRQADALAAYQRARAVLAEGLGLDPSEELQALERAVLRHDLAPVSPPVQRHSLPAPMTSLLGRDRELTDLAELLRSHRLVTLSGIGGAGKTRLALEVGIRQAGSWTGGVWFVDLTASDGAASTGNAVCQALGVRERPDVSAVDTLVEHCRDAELLIILDNCEHVVTASAELVHAVLRSSPFVQVLATSRVPLGVPGEIDYAVQPLPTPADDLPGDQVTEFASVRIFLERGRAVRRDVAPTATHMRAVARICRELDGLPLAIELAAARSKSLSVDDIADRLDDRFRLLRSRHQSASPRHQTLRATFDWSYELLEEEERELLAGLSVFAGGFTLDAVAAVCLPDDLARADELVSRLVDSSLVVVVAASGRARYGLLQTVREYAAERLATSGRADQVRRSHAEYFLEVAEHARTEGREGKAEALDLLDAERENLHSAMRWTLAGGSDLAVPLAARLWRYWLVRGQRRQGLEWLEQALSLPAAAPGPPRSMALAGAALFARLLGDFTRAESFAVEGVALGRAVGPPRALTVSLNVLTTLSARAGDFDGATGYCDESMAVAHSAGDVRLEAVALFILTEGLLHGGRYAEVREVGSRALELARTAGDPEVIAIVLARLGIAAALEHRLEEAAEHLTEALGHARTLGFPETAGWCCEGLALVAAARDDSARAARLLGAGESLRREGGSTIQPAEAAVREATMTALRRALPAERLQVALEAGRGLALDEAAAEAVAAAARVL
jgi:predicted ATPase/DNA-binding SARP family transcriptional activator